MQTVAQKDIVLADPGALKVVSKLPGVSFQSAGADCETPSSRVIGKLNTLNA